VLEMVQTPSLRVAENGSCDSISPLFINGAQNRFRDCQGSFVVRNCSFVVCVTTIPNHFILILFGLTKRRVSAVKTDSRSKANETTHFLLTEHQPKGLMRCWSGCKAHETALPKVKYIKRDFIEV